jgi:hypothetical protein
MCEVLSLVKVCEYRLTLPFISSLSLFPCSKPEEKKNKGDKGDKSGDKAKKEKEESVGT